MAQSNNPGAVIVPATPAALRSYHDAAWIQGVRRVAMPILAFLPFLWDAVVAAVNAGQLHIPQQYAGLWAALMLVVQLLNKSYQVQLQQAHAPDLRANGIPVGEALPARPLGMALTTTNTLR